LGTRFFRRDITITLTSVTYAISELRLNTKCGLIKPNEFIDEHEPKYFRPN
jgi:hypothetical protein